MRWDRPIPQSVIRGPLRLARAPIQAMMRRRQGRLEDYDKHTDDAARNALRGQTPPRATGPVPWQSSGRGRVLAGGRAGCAPQEGEQAAPWAGSPRARAAQAVTATRSGQAAPSRCPGRRTPAIAGMTHQEILEELPYLREEDILACLSYATDQEAQS